MTTERKPVSEEWPEWHLLNPEFKYRPAAQTDVAETFRRARFKLEEEKRNEAERQEKVRRLKP